MNYKKKCDQCRMHRACINPKYRKFWDKKQHKCPVFSKMTRGERFISWWYRTVHK